MISLDPIILEFISKNYMTITVFLGILKIIANNTKWVGDDKIYSLLKGLFSIKDNKIFIKKGDSNDTT